MSAQTIIHPSIESIREESQELFLQNADKYLFKRRFALGEGYCSFEQFDASIVYDIVQSNDCELLNLVKKELDRIEDDEKIKKKCSDEVQFTANQSLYELWLSRGNIGTMDDFLNLIIKND